MKTGKVEKGKLILRNWVSETQRRMRHGGQVVSMTSVKGDLFQECGLILCLALPLAASAGSIALEGHQNHY